MRINSFNELIKFFKQDEITFKDVSEICNKTLFIYFVKDYTKDEAIKILINFWHKWGHTRERPLFIDVHLDVED